ncbi:O-methyltransferase [Tistrella bauzanensis]|uniref:O-methyltransferase n=2 Tax=Tistrella bauzanensis TaxID=657419 RepID=A0ABQ1IUN3_9PROT|nr:methyltransferase [Tistrella bauzanensis]GGB52939.1 O-methyltransferase [Tistrella bauzanensis]
MFISSPEKVVSTTDDMLRLRESAFAIDMFVVATTWVGLFDHLVASPGPRAAVCKALNIHARPADTMFTLLLSWGLLVEDDHGLRPSALALDHMVAGSANDLRPYYASLKERAGVQDLLYVLQSGHSRTWEARHAGKSEAGNAKEEWTDLMRRPDFARYYTAVMDSRGAVLAPDLARMLQVPGARLLDVAGGSGIYSSAIVARHADVSVTVLERPPVDDVARWHIDQRGLVDRIDVIGADMFADPLPEGFDTHLYTHILHDWTLESGAVLLRKSYAALNAGGQVAIYSAHLDDDKAGPAPVAEYSVLMMYLYEGRCYSVAEMRSLMEQAGFVDIQVSHGIGWRSLITGRKA